MKKKKMKFETKYNVGDIITVKSTSFKEEDCPVCAGSGKITAKESGIVFGCPGKNNYSSCYGGKTRRSIPVPIEVKVERIVIDTYYNEIKYYYGECATEDDGDWVDERYIK